MLIDSIFLYNYLKNLIVYIFVKFMVAKKIRRPIIFFFLPLFVIVEIRNPGTGMNEWTREKDLRSATLVTSLCFGAGQAGPGESRGDVNASERQVFFYVPEFFGPHGTRLSARCHFTAPQKVSSIRAQPPPTCHCNGSAHIKTITYGP